MAQSPCIPVTMPLCQPAPVYVSYQPVAMYVSESHSEPKGQGVEEPPKLAGLGISKGVFGLCQNVAWNRGTP